MARDGRGPGAPRARPAGTGRRKARRRQAARRRAQRRARGAVRACAPPERSSQDLVSPDAAGRAERPEPRCCRCAVEWTMRTPVRSLVRGRPVRETGGAFLVDGTVDPRPCSLRSMLEYPALCPYETPEIGIASEDRHFLKDMTVFAFDAQFLLKTVARTVRTKGFPASMGRIRAAFAARA